MPTAPPSVPAVQPVPDRRALWASLLVATIAWTAHFLHFRDFGLYEDDFYVVAPQLALTWRGVLGSMEHTVRTLNQGRPIGFLIATIVPFTCFQLGGLRALPLVYLAASTIVVLNAVLAHRLLFATYGPSFALLGALAFTLYPADTSQPFLTHALVLQPALTLVLLALLAYVHRRRVLAYLLAAGALLTYESGALAFFAAPLLSATWQPGLIRRWVRHVVLVLAIVAAVLALRVAVGEARVVDRQLGDQHMTWGQAPARVLGALWTGPQVSLAAFVTRPAWAMEDVDELDVGLAVDASFAVLFAVLALAPGFAAGMAARPVLVRAGITGLSCWWEGTRWSSRAGTFPPSTRPDACRPCTWERR